MANPFVFILKQGAIAPKPFQEVSMSIHEEPLRTWAEIDLAALRHNLGVAREFAKGREIMAVVKADAYGHGLVRIVEAIAEDVAWFGVANVEEGCEVAAHSRGRVLVLGPILPQEREVAVEQKFVVTLSSWAEAEAFEKLGKPVSAHLAIDSGMGRMGCLENEAVDLVKRIQELKWVKLEGAATHFPSADEDIGYTLEQIARTRELLNEFPDLSEVHLSNSAGLLGFAEEQAFATLMRPGLLLYGVSPLPEFQSRLRPVLSLKSRVTLVRELPAGRGISYGRTFVTKEPTRVATIGVGYGDGYPRHLSS
ncbi:MAG: alanine racemase, partial [Verrucomicrobiota bacterium]